MCLVFLLSVSSNTFPVSYYLLLTYSIPVLFFVFHVRPGDRLLPCTSSEKAEQVSSASVQIVLCIGLAQGFRQSSWEPVTQLSQDDAVWDAYHRILAENILCWSGYDEGQHAHVQ